MPPATTRGGRIRRARYDPDEYELGTPDLTSTQ